jgi:microcystin-dependent protein
MLASTDAANTLNPGNNVVAPTLTATPYFGAVPANPLSPQTVSSVGGNQPHNNFQPYLCVNFIISQFGIFPSQT